MLVVLPSAISSTPQPTFWDSLSSWLPPSTHGALITGIVAVAALLLGQFQNWRSNKRTDRTYKDGQAAFTNTLNEQSLNRDRQFRSQTYRDFLVHESERSDAYVIFSTLKKTRTHNPGKKDSPVEISRLADLETRIVTARKEIDRARAATWTSLSAIQMLGSPALLRAARAYDKAVSAANPMRERIATIPLDLGRKRDLTFRYLAEARKDLGLPAISEEDMFWDEQAELTDSTSEDTDDAAPKDHES